MSKICELTGKTIQFGNNVSHSHRKTRRRFEPNLHHKTYRLPELGTIKLRVTAYAIRIVDKFGGIKNFLLNYRVANMHSTAKKLRASLLKKQNTNN